MSGVCGRFTSIVVVGLEPASLQRLPLHPCNTGGASSCLGTTYCLAAAPQSTLHPEQQKLHPHNQPELGTAKPLTWSSMNYSKLVNLAKCVCMSAAHSNTLTPHASEGTHPARITAPCKRVHARSPGLVLYAPGGRGGGATDTAGNLFSNTASATAIQQPPLCPTALPRRINLILLYYVLFAKPCHACIPHRIPLHAVEGTRLHVGRFPTASRWPVVHDLLTGGFLLLPFSPQAAMLEAASRSDVDAAVADQRTPVLSEQRTRPCQDPRPTAAARSKCSSCIPARTWCGMFIHVLLKGRGCSAGDLRHSSPTVSCSVTLPPHTPPPQSHRNPHVFDGGSAPTIIRL